MRSIQPEQDISDFVARINARVLKAERSARMIVDTPAATHKALEHRMHNSLERQIGLAPATHPHRFNDPAQHVALIARLTKDLHDTLDIGTIGQRALEALATDLGVVSASIILTASDGSIESAHALRDSKPQPISAALAAQALTKAPIAQALRQGRSNVVSVAGRERGPGSLLVLPIQHLKTTFGVLSLYHPVAGRFTAEHLWLTETLAAHIGLAVAAARYTQEEHRRRNQLMSLSTLNQFLTTKHSYAELAAFVQEKSVSVFGADYGIIVRYDPLRGLQPISTHEPAVHAAIMRCADDCARNAWTIRHMVTDVIVPGQTKRAGTCLALPMIHAGQVIGAFVMLFKGEDSSFSATIWSLLTIFGGTISAACANIEFDGQARSAAA